MLLDCNYNIIYFPLKLKRSQNDCLRQSAVNTTIFRLKLVNMYVKTVLLMPLEMMKNYI